ncbi:MAG TPA: alpha-ketoacid dehydrogenase subunit beta [Spirochaetia bacterium]|nr:alpha-ketoacid dehydrogenase subunit beta [Spirochaetia bacterium]
MRELTYAEALREAIAEEMRRDDRVFVLGLDVELGYAFTVTKGLIDEFGPERVRDTPICEQTIVGMSLGAAITGLRPVAEIQFSDLLTMCMDQICNQAAKVRYMSSGQAKAPLVIRTPGGQWGSFAAQHSQTLDGLFIHIPGLKIAVPSTPYDAKGLLKTAIRLDDPVLFMERKQLYRTKGAVPEEEYTIPFGQADVKREGSDLTLVAIGGMVLPALSAAEKLAGEGIEAQVLDPRTLSPLDRESIIQAVKATGRAVIVEEGCKTGGVGGEIAAIMAEEILDFLDAPIQRVAALDTPIPFHPALEKYVMPSEEKIMSACRKVMQ